MKRIVFLFLLFLPMKIFGCPSHSEGFGMSSEMFVLLLFLISLLPVFVFKIVGRVKLTGKRLFPLFLLGALLTSFNVFVMCAWFIVRVLETNITLIFLFVTTPIFVLVVSVVICLIFFNKKSACSEKKEG